MEKFYAFLEQFEQELTCSICNEIITDPVTLPCLHSFCFKCVEQLYEKSSSTNMSCSYPACRSPFDVPDGDVSKLCSSFYLKVLLKLIKIIGTKAKWEGQEIQCVNCEKSKDLVAFCQQCTGVLCTECVSAHKTLKKVSKEHRVKMLNEINRESVEDFVSNLIFCEEESHEHNRLEYFCFEETCRKYICQKCVFETHRYHKLSTVEEAAEEVKQDIRQNIIERVNKLKQAYEEELSLSKQNISRIQSEVELAKTQVHDAVEAVIKKARDHEEAMIKALDEILDEQQQANQGEQSDVNTGINYLSEFGIHCQNLIERNRRYEVLDVQNIFQKKCDVSLQKSSILSSKPIQRNVRLRYVSQAEPDIENIGKIVETLTDPSKCTIESLNDVRCGFENQFEILTKDSEGELCDTNIESIDVKIKDPEDKEVKTLVSIKEKGKFIVQYQAEKVGPCKILVTVGGEEIKNSPQSVNTSDIAKDYVFVSSITYLKEGSKGQLKYPLSIALTKNGEVAVADREIDRIQIFDTSGEYKREIKVKPDGDQFGPESVLFIEDKLLVTGNTAGMGKILEINLTDEKVRTFYRPEEKFYLQGMCVTDENNIAVCFYGNEENGINSGIKLFNKEGNFVREFVSPEEKREPWYVAHSNGKYFVSYLNGHCVCIFDRHGVLLYKFGEQGDVNGQFNKVFGLSFYGPDSILVCDHCNNRVQLLTQEGKFMKSFGSGLFSRMKQPVDLAVTSDGKVFVLNFGSKEIQLWR